MVKKRKMAFVAGALAALACQAVDAGLPSNDGSQEDVLLSMLPDVIARCAANYRALDAAATPLMNSRDVPEDRLCAQIKPCVERQVPHSCHNGAIVMASIYGWTSGHFPGSLWYLYEATGDEFFKDRATAWTEMLAPNSTVTDNHDIGFIMHCSFGNAKRILKTDKYDSLLRETAESLSKRFNSDLGLIRSWGELDRKDDFLVIPDNMMNLELLEEVSKFTEDGKFAAIARSHADVTMKHHFRPDGGTYHVLNYDQRPGFVGKVQEIRRGQGLSCETAWSRGQSWGIYGYTMMYRMTGYVRYLDFAKRLAEYAMNHPDMPQDGIPYWDFGAKGEERDSSAGAIMASALLELSRYVEAPLRRKCRAFAVKQLLALSSGAYFDESGANGGWLLKHGVGHKPGNSEIDVPLDYGDYYYLEALLRFRALKAEDKDLENVLAALPQGTWFPKGDAKRWSALKETPGAKMILEAAEKVAGEPIAEAPDDLYLLFWTTGDRKQYQDRFHSRNRRLVLLAMAEAIDRKGRFARPLVETIDAICSMKSWTLPAHDLSDGEKGSFRGVSPYAELGSTALVSYLACALAIAGDAIPPETAARVRHEAERRIFGPLRLSYALEYPEGFPVSTKDPIGHHWIKGHNNWNAVCHDNVVAAALELLEDARDRAYFVRKAMCGLKFYARGGFLPDGYCSEGMGYWNYGFGHFLMLGNGLRDATGGKLDVFSDPIYRKATEYAYGYQLENGLSPAFSDGTGAPSCGCLALARRIWPDLTCEEAETFDPLSAFAAALDPAAKSGWREERGCLLLAFGKVPPLSSVQNAPLPFRTEFPCGQVWIMRGADGMSAGFKGGNNEELHNHNDLGSYNVALDGAIVTGDPGKEVYTSRTFSSRRYESKILSSYAHPVPRIGGTLQEPGAKSAAKVVKTVFTPEKDIVALDISSAYRVKELKSIVRTFVYDRANGKFSVSDHVIFSRPSSFEVPLVSLGGFREGRVFGEDGKTSLAFGVKASGGEWTWNEETVENPGLASPVIKSIKFASVSEASVAVVFNR